MIVAQVVKIDSNKRPNLSMLRDLSLTGEMIEEVETAGIILGEQFKRSVTICEFEHMCFNVAIYLV